MTSLAATLGTGSLVQIGLGIGDIATLVSLGRTAGNWITAQSGDEDFLKTISADDNVIPYRRGLVDLNAFNKRWKQDCKLLVNGYPQKLDPKLVDDNFKSFSRFTATMVTVTTVLDTFMSTLGVNIAVEGLLTEMLRATDLGHDLMRAELGNRIRAWTSAGVMRGMTKYVRNLRLNLVRGGRILSSYPPIAEAYQIRDLLIWLILGGENTFTTPSSDVAAVATSLSHVAFDLLEVRGLQSREPFLHPSCVVIYNPSAAIFPSPSKHHLDPGLAAACQKRTECSTVPLLGSEDAVSIFPISQEGREKCRFAWKQGQAAARGTFVGVVHPTAEEVDNCDDLTYRFSNHQSREHSSADRNARRRDRYKFLVLVNKHAFVSSNDVIFHIHEALEEYGHLGDWLTIQSSDGEVGEGDEGWVGSPEYTNAYRIEAFSVMQSFFMGYYYQLFLRFVDTRSLEMQVVEGDWGFRSTDLLTRMRQYCLKARHLMPANEAKLKRQDIIEILSALLLNRRLQLENRTRFNHCIGVVGRRTLLTASLLRSADCPNAVGRFVILDSDTGGIPRDSEGIIRPGETDMELQFVTKGTPQAYVEGQPAPKHGDVTRHIEADWAGNRDKLILTFRHEGRRLFSLNTAETDLRICHSYAEPGEPEIATGLSNAIPSGLSDLLEGKLQTGAFGEHPVFFQAYNCPNLRYAAVGVHQSNDLRLASQSATVALDVAPKELPPVIIAAEGPLGMAIRQEAAEDFCGTRTP